MRRDDTPDLSALVGPVDYGELVPHGLLHPPPVHAVPGIDSHLQLVYDTPAGYRPLRLDLHLPRDRGSGPLPVAVYVHGGSFAMGMPAMGPWPGLVRRGIAVAAISYRLSAEAAFPAPVGDVRAALRWVVDNAERHGLDAGRLALWGSSAGAYLAAAATMAGPSTLPDDQRPVPTIGAVVCDYGLFFPARLDDDSIAGGSEQAARLVVLLDHFFDGGQQVAVPDLIERTALPPFLLRHGDDDHRVGPEQSRRFADVLRRHGASCELRILAGADHGSDHFAAADGLDVVRHFLTDAWSRAGTMSR